MSSDISFPEYDPYTEYICEQDKVVKTIPEGQYYDKDTKTLINLPDGLKYDPLARGKLNKLCSPDAYYQRRHRRKIEQTNSRELLPSFRFKHPARMFFAGSTTSGTHEVLGERLFFC